MNTQQTREWCEERGVPMVMMCNGRDIREMDKEQLIELVIHLHSSNERMMEARAFSRELETMRPKR